MSTVEQKFIYIFRGGEAAEVEYPKIFVTQ